MQNQFQKKYFRRAQVVSTLLMLAPFVRAVFLTGSVGRGEATEKSDIDFFIITKKKRLFAGRFFTTALISMMGLRRCGNKIAGRICLNRYHTDDQLEVHLQRKYEAEDYTRAKLLWGDEQLFCCYIKTNQWVKKFNKEFEKKYQYMQIFYYPLFLLQFVFELIFDVFFNDFGERVLKKYQVKKILANPLTQKAKPGQIFISDRELRFHPKKV